MSFGNKLQHLSLSFNEFKLDTNRIGCSGIKLLVKL